MTIQQKIIPNHRSHSVNPNRTETKVETETKLEDHLDPESWLDRYGDFLFNFAMGQVRNPHIAEDLVQETLLSAWSSMTRYDGRSTERTWLIAILRRKIADYIRKRVRERKHVMDTISEETVKKMFNDKGFWKLGVSTRHQCPTSAEDNAEFWQTFIECTRKISPTQADVFCLRTLNGMESTDICNLLQISDSNVSTLLYRARILLRKCMELNWFAPGEILGKGCKSK